MMTQRVLTERPETLYHAHVSLETLAEIYKALHFIVSDCTTPTITNGETAETPKGTTYNEIAIMTCEEGYTLNGNAFVTCQDDGNWTTLPTCDIKSEWFHSIQ